MLINSSQAAVAKYLYDPFGNTLSASGPAADANLYRFSSKEAHPASGLVSYLYRLLVTDYQRWVNRDPVDEAGFRTLRNKPGSIVVASASPYSYVLNRVPNAVDPHGLLAFACDFRQECKCVDGCQAKGLGYKSCYVTLGIDPSGNEVDVVHCVCARPKMCYYSCGSGGDFVIGLPPQGNGKSCQPTANYDGFTCVLIGTGS